MPTFLCIFLLLLWKNHHCSALNLEGCSLTDFRLRINVDPYGIFGNWKSKDNDPCRWSGVYCIDGKVNMLNLSGFSLRGTLAPQIGRLQYLRALILNNNQFYGAIPKEISELPKLELLDLRANNFSGIFPAEIGKQSSHTNILVFDKIIKDNTALKLSKFELQSKLKFMFRTNRKIGHLFKSLVKDHSQEEQNIHHVVLESFATHNFEKKNQHVINYSRRKLFEGRNLAAAAAASVIVAPSQEFNNTPSLRSGSFPAFLIMNGSWKPDFALPVELFNTTSQNPFPVNVGENKNSVQDIGTWVYVLLGFVALILTLIILITFLSGHSHGMSKIIPFKTGSSGQLQRAFVTGIPKLHREELETACEDFSNIIESHPEFTIFKGTLSSGVEIAVLSTVISSAMDWSIQSEALFRRKIDTLSRVNHRNFVNILGYCEVDEPFMRAMVCEYPPNGTLYENLHLVKECEHLNWSIRMRIIMGITYCLQYMHHELSPPVSLPNLQSSSIYLTDDYAAKIADMDVWKDVGRKIWNGEDEGDIDDPETTFSEFTSNVYDFGLVLLEIISGKPAYSVPDGAILVWSATHLDMNGDKSHLVDPTLTSINDKELDAICLVIRECVDPDLKKRPTMQEVATKLRSALNISPASTTPNVSPLWWAELEILSFHASN